MTTITETRTTTTQVYEVFIKASPEQIWEGITNPDFTEQYFYGSRANYDLRPGGRYAGVAAGDESQQLVDGEVVESDPPRRLIHTWRALYDPETAVEPYSRVSWEIEPQDGGFTKLTVVHDRLDESPKTALSVAGGWSYVLSGLKTLLETGKPLAEPSRS
jgi:uncharacterized protein YndB with AHSA1/START domain